MVLLDHGLYKELDFHTRNNYASLWKVHYCFFFIFSPDIFHLRMLISSPSFSPVMQALVFADAKAIKEYSAKLGAGDDLYALFAGVLTMRPWNRVVDQTVDHLVIQGSESERSELQVSCVYGRFRIFGSICLKSMLL